MRKRCLISILILVVIVAFATVALSTEFWGSAKSKKYHIPTCRWAKKIKEDNRIVFASPEDAVKAGYEPCKTCKPPLESQKE